MVKVRLMACVEVWKWSLRRGRSGKYIVAVRGDVVVAKPRSAIRNRFCLDVKVVYGGVAASMAGVEPSFEAFVSMFTKRLSSLIFGYLQHQTPSVLEANMTGV